jgi:outer membrane protein LpxR
MLRYLAVACAFTLSLANSGLAQGAGAPTDQPVDTEYKDIPSPFEDIETRRKIGYGRLFTNDTIGDGQDRWRTGAYTFSNAYGYAWNGAAPSRFGELLEFRLQGQIIAPDNLAQADPNDRPWAGAVSVGLHTHGVTRGLDYAVGADLVVIGPQTQLDSLQEAVHNLFGKPTASAGVLALQIPDTIRPTVVGELGRTYEFGDAMSLRPFAEMRAGDETLARVGADFMFGSVGQKELLARESITGQRYRVVYNSQPGYSLTVGADTAYVSDSVYLPENRGYQLSDRRDRVRAGVHWQGGNASAFYGLTYLGREFSGQSEGQVTGSVRLKLRF